MIKRLMLLVTLIFNAGCMSTADDAARLQELQRAKAGAIDVVLLSSRDALKQGKDSSILEFRSGSDQGLVDVGTVKVSATMPMAGMSPMIGSANVRPAGVGRYALETDLSMAGSWRLAVEWDGPAGKGSASLPGQAQ